jgi:hypothetical protein
MLPGKSKPSKQRWFPEWRRPRSFDWLVEKLTPEKKTPGIAGRFRYAPID